MFPSHTPGHRPPAAVSSRLCFPLTMRRFAMCLVIAAVAMMLMYQMLTGYVARQERLLGCKPKSTLPPEKWSVFDLEEVFAGRDNVTMDEVLTAYTTYHLKTAGSVLSDDVAGPILISSNNMYGFGNRQYAFVDVFLYSIIMGRAYYHDWSDPFSSKLFYSPRLHPVMETIDYDLSRNFLSSLDGVKRFGFEWRACQNTKAQTLASDQVVKAEFDSQIIHLDGWGCYGIFKTVLNRVYEEQAPTPRMLAAKHNMMFLTRHFGFERSGEDWGYPWLLPYFMEPSQVMSRVIQQIESGFGKGDVTMCVAIRAGSKTNGHIRPVKDLDDASDFYSACARKYAAHIRGAQGRNTSVLVMSDNVKMRDMVVGNLGSHGVHAFTSGEFPVHASNDEVNVGLMQQLSKCDLSRGTLLSAAEQLTFSRCDIVIGTIESSFHMVAMNLRLRKPVLSIRSESHKKFVNFDVDARKRIFPRLRLPDSPFPPDLCSEP